MASNTRFLLSYSCGKIQRREIKMGMEVNVQENRSRTGSICK